MDTPMEDPYALEGYGGHLRGDIKRAFNIIINCATVPQAIGSIDGRIGKGQLSSELLSGERLIRAFNETHPLLRDKIASGEGSIGKLVNDDTTVDNLNSTLDSIESGIGTLNETMGRYRRYRLEVALHGEYMPTTDTSRSAFGFDLWTTDKRFFRLEGVDTPYGKVKTDSQYVTTILPDGTETSYEQTKISTSDKVGITAQVGYRLFPATIVRAGIIESSGGVVSRGVRPGRSAQRVMAASRGTPGRASPGRQRGRQR